MRICRFQLCDSRDDAGPRLGVVEHDRVRDVTSVLEFLPAFRYPLPCIDVLVTALFTPGPGSIRGRVSEAAKSADVLPLSSVHLLSPVANPGKIVAAPVNYQKHLDEATADPALHQGNMAQIQTIQRTGLFLKATSSLTGPADGIHVGHAERRTDHEIELVAVIGAPAKNVSRAEALRYVAGYCIGLDITMRGAEERSLRKSADSYSVVGPWMVTADELSDPSGLELALSVNGEPRQRANTRDLILGVAELIEFASSFYQLNPGDLLFTGTPEGVGPIQAGDTILASITGIGEMTVRVKDA